MKLLSRLKIIIPVLLITFVLSACRQSEIIYRGPNLIYINNPEPLLIENFISATNNVNFLIADEKIAIIDGPIGSRKIQPRVNGQTELIIYVDGIVKNRIEVNIGILDFEFLEAKQVSVGDITLEQSGNIVNFSSSNTAILIKFNGENSSIVEQQRYVMRFPGTYEFIYKDQNIQPKTIANIDLDVPNVQFSRDLNIISSDYYLPSFKLRHNDEVIDFNSIYQIQEIGSHSLLLTYTDYKGEIKTLFEETIEIKPNFTSIVPSTINRPISLQLRNIPERVIINDREVSFNRDNEIFIRRRGVNEINIYGVNDYVQTYTITYNNQFYDEVIGRIYYWIPILILGIITIGIKIPKVMKR